MAQLLSGEYVTKTARSVVLWPKADANGDGEQVWVQRYDDNGNVIGRDVLRDAQNRTVYEYLPPDGFQNRPSYDHTDNFVKVDQRGNVVRDKNGEAIGIKPGRAVVFNPDGTVEYLDDEYSQHLFRLAHDSTSDTPEETEEEKETRRQAQLEAKRAELQRQMDALQ